MSVKLDKRNTTIDSQILTGNVSPSKVYQPQWINNQTRLNQTNVELMRSNLIKYVDLVAGSLFTNIENDINSIIDKSAGWVQINTTDGNIVGEIFNDYDNNKVSPDKKYQATFGTYTEANGEAQFVCGKYNEKVDNALFIVGCGNEEDRQNALVINNDGTVKILKDVTFDGKETFNGTVTFSDRVTLTAGFDANSDSEVDGKLTVTKAPTAKTHVVRKKELDDLRSEISGALHYIGVTNVPPTNEAEIGIYEINNEGKFELKATKVTDGDVVLVGQLDEDGNIIYTDETGSPTTDGREYIYNGKTWTYYGAYANYIPKMEYENEQEKLNKALFSDGTVPEWSDTNTDPLLKSLQTQLETKIGQEATNRETADEKLYGGNIPQSGNLNMTTMDKNRKDSDRYITGLPDEVPTSGTYKDSNTKLRSDLTQEVTAREKVDSNISGLDTIPQDYENSNEKLRLKIDDINTALGFLADKDVIDKEPSMTLTASTIKSQEIGTVIIPSYSTTFDPGAYEYEPTETGITVDELAYEVTFNGETKTTGSGSFTQLTVDNTSKTLTAKITYPDGNVPKNNLGLDYTEGKISGGTISKSLTLSGYRQGCFYGTVTTVDMTVDKITSSLIRGLTKSNKAYTKGNITLSIPKGATAILIACPTTETGPTNVINTTVNAPMTDLYDTSKIIKTLTVAGAGADPGIEYNVWMYVPAEAYNSTANLTITLG